MSFFRYLIATSAFIIALTSAAVGQDAAAVESAATKKSFKVLIKPIEPFVSNNPDNPSGFSIDLWDLIARENGWKTDYVFLPTLKEMFDGMRKGQGNVALAAISITSEREQEFDFSYPYFNSGLQVLVKDAEEDSSFHFVGAIRDLFWSRGFAIGALIFLLSVFIVSNIIWLVERKRNDHFSPHYIQGIADGFWWAVVTVTSVGYGDKTPSRPFGKAVALLWMIFGYFMFAYFTAVVTSKVTVEELRGSISGPDDLFGKKVAVIEQSVSAAFFVRRGQGRYLVPVGNIEEAYALLRANKVEAVVHDAPVLNNYTKRGDNNDLRVVGPLFNNDEYGILLPRASNLREQIDLSILRLRESGAYQELYKKWFGDRT